MSQLKSRSVKKSVSFTVQSADLQDKEFISVSVVGNYKSLLVLPFHLPFLLYGMFSRGLTERPMDVMFKGAAVLAVVQMNYGYFLARVALADSSHGKKSKKKSKSRLPLVLFATLFSLVLTPVLFVALVLFGAPLYGYLSETYILGVHLSLMMIQPLLIAFKMDFDQIHAVFKSPGVFKIILANPVLCGGFTCALGTWLGVIPIPLDWDKPWQQWPITLLAGGYVGCSLGYVVGYLHQFF